MNRNNVTHPGTVFVVQKEGLAADLATDATYWTSRIVDGEPSQRGGVAAFFSKSTTKRLTVGERVYLMSVDVKDDRLRVGMITVDMTAVQKNGSTRQSRYGGYADFEFDQATMSSMDLQNDWLLVSLYAAAGRGPAA